MVNFSQLQEEVSKAYQRYKLKSYKIYDKAPKTKQEFEPLFNEILSYIESLKDWLHTKLKNTYYRIPKNKTQLIGAKNNFVSRYEKPEPPESQGDLSVTLKNKWSEEVNTNNSEKLEFMATHRKVVDLNDTVYTVSLECLKHRNQDEETVSEEPTEEPAGEEEDLEEEYELYLDVEVLHTQIKGDDDEYYNKKQAGEKLFNPNQKLVVTKNTRIEKNVTGIDELESKINELISKYDHDTIEMMIRDLQEQDKVYVN